MTDICWSWIERLFKRISIDYRLVSGLAGTIALIIFIYASFEFRSFHLQSFRVVEIASISILIAVEPIGIIYFLSKLKQIVTILKDSNVDRVKFNSLKDNLEYRFTKARLYKVLIVLFLIPPICMDTYGIWEGVIVPVWLWERTMPSLLFTFFYFFVFFLIIFMTANILWILINISHFFNKLADEQILSEINVFYGFQVGFLYNARDLLIKFSSYYFLCVTLLILSYISPSQLVSFQMLYFIYIDLVGISFFLYGWFSLQDIFRSKWQKNAIEIDDLYNMEYKQLMKAISRRKRNEKELQSLFPVLDMLQKQKDLLKLIVNNGSLLDLVKVSISFFATVLAFGQQFFNILGLKTP